MQWKVFFWIGDGRGNGFGLVLGERAVEDDESVASDGFAALDGTTGINIGFDGNTGLNPGIGFIGFNGLPPCLTAPLSMRTGKLQPFGKSGVFRGIPGLGRIGDFFGTKSFESNCGGGWYIGSLCGFFGKFGDARPNKAAISSGSNLGSTSG